jgi:hypothetical protein
VLRESILRESAVIPLHDPVPGNLGKNGSSGDRVTESIACWDGTMRDRTIGGSITVDQDEIRGRVERIDGLLHGQQGRLQDIHGIDDVLADHAESDGHGRVPDGHVKLLASPRAEPFGVVNPIDD